MEPISLEKELSKLMEGHEVPFTIENEWIVPFSKLPAIRATWFQKEKSGVLEIEVLLEDNRVINECFAGIDVGKEGIADALQNFCVNSFHVFLAAFWQHDNCDQITVETWKSQNKEYTAFIGNFGTRGSAETNPEIPQGLFEAIQNCIEKENLDEKISWFRFFFCNISGDQIFEALKNNEISQSGLSTLKSLPWIKKDGYYSVRNFLILKEKEMPSENIIGKSIKKVFNRALDLDK